MTKEILNNQIKMLNSYSKAKYGLFWAYGKVQLVRYYERGGQSALSNFCTKAELGNILGALITYAAMEESAK